MKLSFNKCSSELQRKFGICVATNPVYFIITPIFVSIILVTGLQRWTNETNIKYLYGPINERYVREEATIKKLFHMDLSTNAYMERMNREPCFSTVLITAKDGGSVLRQHAYKEILLLDEIIQNITITGEKILKYKDLCAKNNKKCFENNILLEDKIEMMRKQHYSIKYPLSQEGMYDFHLSSLFLGGVELDVDKNVKSSKAIKLYYYLNDDSVYKEHDAKQWLRLFLDTLESISFKYITVDKYASITFSEEVNQLMYKGIPRLPILIISIFLFSLFTCLYGNWIESKPWIGATAQISALLSVASSFGLLMYFNVRLVPPDVIVPFVILGIGMDDAFVFLAAWRRTDNKNSVSDRLGEVYSESTTSVTVTSVTNFVAFIIGIFSPYNVMKYTCLYAAISIFFCYIYQMTFVGACMAIFGYLEKENRHSLLFLKIKTANDRENQSWIRKYFLSNRSWKSENNIDGFVSIMFKQLGNILSITIVKIFVFLLASAYMAVGFWGIMQIDNIGKYSEISPSDSYFVKFLENDYKYFSLYKHRFQIVIDEEINYADLEIQRKIQKMFSDMKDEGLIEDSLTESWLRIYLKFLQDERTSFLVKDFNTSNTENFIKVLRQIFHHHPATKHFRNDITFNNNYTAIVGSRFLCQTNFTENEKADIAVVQKMRLITDKAPFSVFPYIHYSCWVDDINLRIKFTTEIICSIVVIVIFTCFIFMHDIITTFSNVCSVISTEICTLGYMSLWNVTLAPVSIMVLVMCAGFSVDFSTHFSYAYKNSHYIDFDQRLRSSISWIGHAIFQGSITTIISVLPFAYPLSYMHLATFKIVFLVILFSLFNALVLVPVILVTLNNIKQMICIKKENITGNTRENEMKCENINLGFYSTGSIDKDT